MMWISFILIFATIVVLVSIRYLELLKWLSKHEGVNFILTCIIATIGIIYGTIKGRIKKS